jgi:hypothetical protein
LRPWWLLLGHFALGDAVGPVAEIFVGHAAELSGKPVRHHLAGLTGLGAAHPRFVARLELAKLRGDGTRRFLPELMTADAVDVVHPLAPGFLRDVLRDLGGASEIARRRDLHHRVPIDRRIVVRGRSLVGGCYRGVIDDLAGLRPHPRRIHEPVAAHPHLVICGGEIGDDIAALIVGDDALDIPRRQIGCFRDHPHAGLGPVRAGDHAADVVIVDRDRRLGTKLRRRSRKQGGNADRRHGQIQRGLESHGSAPRAFFCMALAAYARLGTRARRCDCAQSMSLRQ